MSKKILPGIIGVACYGLLAIAIPVVPFFLKLDLLPGWFVILLRLAPLVVTFPILLKLVQPDKKVFTFGGMGWCALMVVILFAFNAGAFLSSDKVSEYIRSPSGENRAVVLTDGYGSKTIYAVKARLFYERFNYENRVSVSSDTLVERKWIDDNTLEIVKIYEDGSEETEHIRW
jgi:hypothetical protein